MKQLVGKVSELWRYPVKSMAGNSVDQAFIEKPGMQSDRGWAIRDEQAGELTNVRKMPRLLLCSANYVKEPQGKQIPHVLIQLPDGSTIHSSEDKANEQLSEYLKKPVTLWPLQARSNWRHYRNAKTSGAAAMKKQFAAKELPDMSSISWSKMLELAVFSTPLGRYYDCYPLHILTSNTLLKLSELEPQGGFCPQRFRPNIFIESLEKQARFDEFLWLDGHLHIGKTIIKCESRTIRCSMPSQPQVGFAKDSKVLRTLEKHTGRHLGINASVLKSGEIQVGDAVEWIPASDSFFRNRVKPASDKLRSKLIHFSLQAIDGNFRQRK
jgi:hypothetical protein